MINHFVTNIGNIALFGMISIVLFFAVFTGAVGFAFCMKKTFVSRMSALPLSDEEKQPTKDISHE
jgi:hypothetical protein